MAGIERVAERMHKEIGLSQAASLRITRKLNRLAGSVSWAKPVLVSTTIDKKSKSYLKPNGRKVKTTATGKKSQVSHR